MKEREYNIDLLKKERREILNERVFVIIRIKKKTKKKFEHITRTKTHILIKILARKIKYILL